jgi:hypothetical protein
MRHIGTLIAAILIAPLAWILLAAGQERSVEAFSGTALSGGDFAHPVELLAGAGLLLGILGTLRFSPLGAVLTGLAYATSYAALLAAPNSTLHLFDHGLVLGGHQVNPATPLRNGTVLVLGGLLLVSVFSVGRWRRRPGPDRDGYDDEADRPVGLDGLGLEPAPARPLATTHSYRAPRPREPEPEPEYATQDGTGFRPKPRVAGLRSPWGGREDGLRW